MGLEKKIVKQMTREMKLKVLARYFYAIDDQNSIYFDDLPIDNEEIIFCHFVAHRCIEDKKADDLLKSLISTADIIFIKIVERVAFGVR